MTRIEILVGGAGLLDTYLPGERETIFDVETVPSKGDRVSTTYLRNLAELCDGEETCREWFVDKLDWYFGSLASIMGVDVTIWAVSDGDAIDWLECLERKCVDTPALDSKE